MTGFVIGIGDGWPHVAKVCARRMEHMTGIKSIVLTEDPFNLIHPSWLKCKIPEMYPDEESYFIYDADLLPIREWTVMSTWDSPEFIGAPDRQQEMIVHECVALGIPDHTKYINCGLMIFNNAAKHVVQNAFSRYPVCGNWLEQGSVNMELQINNPGLLTTISQLYNQHAWTSTLNEAIDNGVINAHLTGLRGRWDLVDEVHRKLGWGL